VSAPLLPLALLVAAGVWLGLRISPPGWIAPGGLAIAALVTAAARGRRPAIASVGALGLATLAGWARVGLPDPFPPVSGVGPGPALLEGLVGGVPEVEGPRTRLPLVLRQAGDPGRPASGMLPLAVYGTTPAIAPGDRLRVRAVIRAQEPFRNPGIDPGRPGPRTPRYLATARADGVERLEPVPLPWWLATRLWIHAVVAAHLPPVSGSLLEGLLIGDRRQLPPTLLLDFRRAGVLHVLAISGFNVGLVVAATFLVLRLGRVPPHAAALLSLATLVAFAGVVGGQASVLRATVMGGLFLVAGLLGRETRTWNSLAAALLVLLALDPGSLAEPGLQLSFAATAGLLHLGPWLRARVPARCPRPVANALAISAGAQLGVTPVTLAYWGQLSPLGVAANLLVVPLAAVLTVGGVLALALAVVSEAVAHLVFQSLWCLLVALRLVVRAIAALPGAVVQVPPPSPVALGAATVALALAPYARGRAAWLLVAALAGAAVAGTAGAMRPDGLARVVLLDTGHGEAVLVRAPDGPALLVDTGGGGPGRGDRGERVVVPALRRLGIDRLAAVALTSPAADHRGGLPGILDGLAVDEIWLPREPAPPDEPAGAPETVPRRRLARGERRWVGSLLVTVLHPPGDDLQAPGADRLLLRVEWGLFAAVLGADADRATQAAVVAGAGPLRAPVLKVSAHGSERRTEPALLDAVAPRFAAIAVAARNPFGHPAPAVVGRLAAGGATVYRTDRDGAVEFSSDGARLWVRAWRRAGPPEEFLLRGGP
jgi:competence protein ComEC